MKKVLLAILLFSLAVASACASAFNGVQIEWAVAYSAYNETATDLTGTNNAILDTYGVTWQLIFAGANDVSDHPTTVTGGPNGDYYVSGDDVVWSSRLIPQSAARTNVTDDGGRVWSAFLENQSGNTVYKNTNYVMVGSEFVYQRIFGGTPAQMSWYFESPVFQITAWDPVDDPAHMPQVFSLGTPSLGIQPELQIPEPATMGLLGLGALALAIRRRRSS